MATTFDLPAAPSTGQEATLPGGVVMRWNGLAWEFKGTAFNAGDYVLKAGDTMLGALKLADGTVAAPALAWGSEPGMGWYRSAAGIRRFAVGGGNPESLNASAANATYINWSPRAAGQSVLSLSNDAVGAANFNSVSLAQNQDGNAAITGNFTGSASAKTLGFNGFSGVGFSMPIAAPTIRWGPTGLGSGTYLGFSGNDPILNWSPGWNFVWQAASGHLYYQRSGQPTTQFLSNGDFYAGGNIVACGTNGGLALNQNGANPHLRFTGDLWKLEWGAGFLTYYNPGGTALWQADGINGHCYTRGSFIAGLNTGGGSFAFSGGGGTNLSRTQLTFGEYQVPAGNTQQAGMTASPAGLNMQLEFRHAPGTFADTYLGVGSGVFTFDNNGVAAKSSGAGQWNGISDIRLKEDVEPLAYGLAEIERLEPITYRFIERGVYADDSLNVGLSAQATEAVMPLMVYKTPDPRFEDGVYGLRPDYVQYALVNAVKELSARNAALEQTVLDLMDRVLVLEGKA